MKGISKFSWTFQLNQKLQAAIWKMHSLLVWRSLVPPFAKNEEKSFHSFILNYDQIQFCSCNYEVLQGMHSLPRSRIRLTSWHIDIYWDSKCLLTAVPNGYKRKKRCAKSMSQVWFSKSVGQISEFFALRFKKKKEYKERTIRGK